MNVHIMILPPFAAHQRPYSTHVQTRGSREGPAAAARARRVSLADDSNASAGLLALVLQLRLEHPPAGIEHGFRHPRLDQFGATHVSNNDGLIPIDNFSGKLMHGILAAARCRAAQPLRLAFVTAPLCLGELALD